MTSPLRSLSLLAACGLLLAAGAAEAAGKAPKHLAKDAAGPVIEALDSGLEEAASCLGASRFYTFRRVVLPAVAPALLSGTTMAFARGLGEYGSVIFIAGNLPGVSEILPLLIVARLESYDFTGATVLAFGMLVISFVLLLSVNLLEVWHGRRSGAGRVKGAAV